MSKSTIKGNFINGHLELGNALPLQMLVQENQYEETLRQRWIDPGKGDLHVPFWRHRMLGHWRLCLKGKETVL